MQNKTLNDLKLTAAKLRKTLHNLSLTINEGYSTYTHETADNNYRECIGFHEVFTQNELIDYSKVTKRELWRIECLIDNILLKKLKAVI